MDGQDNTAGNLKDLNLNNDLIPDIVFFMGLIKTRSALDSFVT